MSTSGDFTVIRNGRPTNHISVYNYPEHLNPFYEDDNHNRLRFWRLKDKNGTRRNSFSIGDLIDMWSFKPFRLKKKSSTLGVNKTSESPPQLRRPFDRDLRYSTINGNTNFQRSAHIRSSLQTVYHHQSPDKRSNGYNLGNNRLAPLARAGYHSSQQLNDTDVTSIISRGSSQVSVVSTNPFEVDNDSDNGSLSHDTLAPSSASTPKRAHRKKRRAPAPPMPVVEPNNDISCPSPSHERDDNNKNNTNILDISNLAAEIESFVKTTTDPPTVVNDCHVDANDAAQKATETKEYPQLDDVASQAADVPIVSQLKVNDEATEENKIEGTIVVVRDDRGSPTETDPQVNNNEASVRTPKVLQEYKKDVIAITTKDTEDHKGSVKITVIEDDTKTQPDNVIIEEEAPRKKTKEIVTTKRREEVELKAPKREAKIKKPVRETKQEYVESTKKEFNENILASGKHEDALIASEDHVTSGGQEETSRDSRKSTAMNVVDVNAGTELKPRLELMIREDDFSRSQAAVVANPLKIVEPDDGVRAFRPYEDEPSFGGNTFVQDQARNNLLYYSKLSSYMTWRNSTLAPLEPNVPPEKRKSVKDIIESINRSQRLLTAPLRKNKIGQNTYRRDESFCKDNTTLRQDMDRGESAYQPYYGERGYTGQERRRLSLDSSPRESSLKWNPVTKPRRSSNLPSPDTRRRPDYHKETLMGATME